MLPTAILCHDIPGRLRVKVAAKRGDQAYFARVTQQFMSWSAVQAANANAVSASVVLNHCSTANEIGHYALAHSLFELAADGTEVEPVITHVTSTLGQANQVLRSASGGYLDLASLLYIGFAGLTTMQLLRGQVAGPATTLLWNTLSLAQFSELAKKR